MDQIESKCIILDKFDQIGLKWIKLDGIGSTWILSEIFRLFGLSWFELIESDQIGSNKIKWE